MNHTNNDPRFTSCAVRYGRVMLGRSPLKAEDDLAVLGCMSSDAARKLAEELLRAAAVADRKAAHD